MQLSAELFEEIVRTLHSDEKHSLRHEKRKEGRVGVRCSIEITPRIFDDSGQTTLRVKVRDISPSGMGFTNHDRMAIGLELICKLPCEHGHKLEVVMIVRHCVKISQGLYNVGASFDSSTWGAGAAKAIKNGQKAAIAASPA
jgi:hypothetical protein